VFETMETEKGDRIMEADGHIIGECIENVFFEELGITSGKDNVYVKRVDNHVEIGGVKVDLIR